MPKIFAVIAMLSVPLVSTAHHSFATYSDQIVEIEGELLSVRWGNPHARLTLKGTDGQNWTLEAAAVYVLERRGLLQELFRLGDNIKVAGRLNRTQDAQIWLHNLLLGDGRELLMIGGVDPRWTDDALGGNGALVAGDAVGRNRGLFRVWSQPALRPINYGDSLPYRDVRPLGGVEWISRLDGFAARCESVGMPGVMATPYPIEFVDHGSSIQLLGFSNNALIDRTLYLSDATDLPAPGRFGRSAARWENEQSLVVNTTRIDWPYFDDSLGTPQSDRLETVERFTLSEDQNRLDYAMTVTDPVLFTAPAIAIETHWVALDEALAQPSYCAE